MQHPNRSRWPIRDILALAVVALCALVVLAALRTPGGDVFDQILPLIVGLVAVVVKHYFGGRP